MGIVCKSIWIVLFTVPVCCAAGAAQEGASQEGDEDSDTQEAVQLEAIEIEDTRVPAAFRGLVADQQSGLSVVDKTSATALDSGSGDALDVLRLLPNVHFDVNQLSVRAEDLQDLRPSDISISGGQVYDNSIRIDGVAVDNVMDVTQDNPYHFLEVAGAAAQTVFLDPSLIERLEVRDSDIPARYGEFSGGVVDAKLRDPADSLGASLGFGFENDNLTEYEVDDAELAAADPPPVFTKWRLHGTLDVPLHDRAGLLFGFGRSQSEVDYALSEGYGGQFRGHRSTSDNFLVKGLYDFGNGTELRSSLVYSPYVSEAAHPNGIDNLIESNGGGLTFKTELGGAAGELNWLLRGSYVDADMSRNAQPYSFSWSSAAPSIDFCSNRNCTKGGSGDIEQYQRDYTLEAQARHPVFGGELEFGVEFGRVRAFKSRQEEGRAYMRGTYNADTVCADPDDPACIDGEIALSRYSAFLPFTADVEVDQGSIWAEQSRSLGDVDLRLGLRMSWDDYLEHTNLAPRLLGAWNIRSDIQLSAGLSRYYTRNFVGYAIRSQYPDFYRFDRTGSRDGSSLVFDTADWSLSRTSVLTGYRDAGLDTPYSDETTLALSFPVLSPLEGVARLKVVEREHRDQIVRLPIEQITEVDDTGEDYTRRVYFPSNHGATDYLGLSAQWVGRWRNTALTMSVAWSETVNNADDLGTYFDGYDAEDLATDFVLYQGRIVSVAELQDDAYRENFATPMKVDVSATSAWFDNALVTALWFHWKDEYETIGDTGVNEVVDGTRYDVYDTILRDASLRVDANLTYALPEFAVGRLAFEVRVSNLLSELPHTDIASSRPYQRGRSIRLGMNWVF